MINKILLLFLGVFIATGEVSEEKVTELQEEINEAQELATETENRIKTEIIKMYKRGCWK